MTLSLEDTLAIKNKHIRWVFKKTLVDNSGEMSVRDHDHLKNPILPGGSNFR